MSKRKRDDDSFESDLLNELTGYLKIYHSDVTPLLEFLRDGKWRRILQAWSYFSQNSNHEMLSKITSSIGYMIENCDKNINLVQHGLTVSRDILDHHSKILNRCFTIGRPNVTNPAIRLVRNIACYHKGVLCGDLFATLDFSLQAYPKMLIRKEIRPEFVRFYISLIKYGSHSVKKDAFAQKKIVGGWLKDLHRDAEQIQLESVQVLSTAIVHDLGFSKSFKIGLFNDWVMGYLSKLLSASEPVAKATYELMQVLCTDPRYGVVFPDNGWTSTKINNSLLVGVLNSLRPWEDTTRQELAVQILDVCPELRAVYTESMGKNISFDPKLSYFWICYASFHMKLLKLDEPDLEKKPLASIVVENVAPQTLSKSALIKTLSHESGLVVYMGVDVMVQILRKLQSVKRTYASKKWDATDVLIGVQARLPDFESVNKTLKSIKSGELMHNAVLRLVALYVEIFPQVLDTNEVVLPSNLVDVQTQLDALQLTQATSALSIQSKTILASKWYNKSAGTNSVFTRLVKLAVANPPLLRQTRDFIVNLTNPTMMFQRETLAHPVDALFASLINAPELTVKVWDLLDESVARCMRVPYQYADEMSKFKLKGPLSILSLVLLEQLKFVDSVDVNKWLSTFLLHMSVIGENSLALAESLNFKITGKEDQVIEGLVEREINSVLQLAALQKLLIQRPSSAQHFLNRISGTILDHTVQPQFYSKLLASPVATLYLKFIHSLQQAGVHLDLHHLRGDLETLPDEIKCEALWLDLTVDPKSTNPHVLTRYIENKTFKRVPLSLDDIGHLAQFENDSLSSAMEQNLAVTSQQLNAHDQQRYLAAAEQTGNEVLLCIFIQYTGSAVERVKSQKVAAALARYCTSLDTAILEPYKHVSADMDSDKIAIISRLIGKFNEQDLRVVEEFVSSADGKIALSDDFVELAIALKPRECVRPWAVKTAKWLSTEFNNGPSKLAIKFAESYGRFLCKSPVAAVLTAGAVEQLCVSCIEQHSPESIDLLNSVMFSHSKLLNSVSLFDELVSKIASVDTAVSLALWKLVSLSPKELSTEEHQDRLLAHYKGTNSASDLILLDTIEVMESRLGTSWVNRVVTFQITSDSSIPLYRNDEERSVSLDSNMIRESVLGFNGSVTWTLDDSMTLEECRNSLQEYTTSFVTQKHYDPRFLLMAIISSPELFRDNATIDVKLLVESSSLAFIIACISHSTLADAAVALLRSILSYCDSHQDDPYRELLTVRILVSKIMATLDSDSPPCIWLIVAQLVSVLSNPGHFLYPKSVEFLLSGPKILVDIPLFKSITKSSDEHVWREIGWMLDSLTNACNTSQDVAMYLKRGVVEWALNLVSSPFATTVRVKVRALIARVIETPNGSLSLVTRNALIASIECGMAQGSKELESVKLGTRMVLTADPARLRQWTSGDVDGVLRRLSTMSH